MILLAVSIALGAVALYGEKQMHTGRVKEIRDALEKHASCDETVDGFPVKSL